MKTSLLLLAALASSASAAVTISNFTLTTTSVSFDIAGTMPNAGPEGSAEALFFANSNGDPDPGFALGFVISSNSRSFTGSQALRAFATGVTDFGDYFFIAFENPLTPNEAINGTFNATWNVPAFDLSQVSSLDVRWGLGFDLPELSAIDGGVLLGVVAVVAVPEPSSAILLGLSGLALLYRRRAC